MSDQRKDSTVATDKAEQFGKKQPYEKPSFRHERAFETMALTCGKVDPSQQQCQINVKHS
ncbi:MAG: hypothetical protein WBD73_04725 [Candidatus Acidiferrales bacterium]